MIRRIKQWWWHRSGDARRRLTRLCTAASVLVFIALAAVWVYLARQEWVKDEPDTIILNMIVLAFVAQLLLVSLVLSRLEGPPWFLKWFGSLSAEFAGALILSALLLFLVTMPNQRRETSELKRGLIREMRSSDNAIALLAVEELREQGWLFDGTLQRAFLWYANLQGAHLGYANLQGAYLGYSNLQGAHLGYANLQGAYLGYANLQGADLWYAHLQGVYLWKADLKGASLLHTTFDETTTLPDGTHWTPDTDMTCFTDPNHPEFWRSDDPRSPAYQGNGE